MLNKFGLILLVLLPLAASGQGFRTGIKAGGNLSYLGTGADATSNTLRPGYHIGWLATWDLPEFGFMLEIVYSTQGGKISFPTGSYEENYNYLNIPITMKFDIGSNFNLHFGPYLGFLLSADQIETIGNDENYYNIEEFVAGTDYGLFGGVGYDLGDAWMFELRYNYGMTDVEIRDNAERRNRFIQLSATYFLVK